MALNVNAALMQLDPLKPLGPRPDKKAESMERQRLQLMREQFEEAKRQNAQDAEWRKIAEAGEMTRAQMASDRQAQHDQELAVAENIKQRTLAFDSFNKRVDSADYEGMDLDATRVNQLGGMAELTGRDENGFPSYRVEFDAEEARKRDAEQEEQAAPFFSDEDETPPGAYGSMEEGMSAPPRLPRESTAQSLDRLNALGYDTLGLRDNLAGTGVGEGQQLSTEDAFRSAQRAARGPDEPAPAAPDEPAAPAPWQPGNLDRDEPGVVEGGPDDYDYAGEADAAKNFLEPGRSTPMAPPSQLEPSIFQATGRPARGPDQRDIMGGVPKNVIDTGSMQDQRKQRLGPVMDNMVKSMPQAYQAGTRASGDAALAMGLPADKAVKQALDLNAPANAAQANELEAERKEKAEERKAIEAAKLDPQGEQKLINYGHKRADLTYQRRKIQANIEALESVTQIEALLDDKYPENDAYAINFLMKAGQNVGHQSETDAARFEGLSSASTIEQVQAWVNSKIQGGTYETMKKGMKEFTGQVRERGQKNVFSWMESTQKAAAKAEHPLVRKGYEEYLDSVPDWVKEAYEKTIPEEENEPPAGTDAGPASGATQGAGYTPPVRGAADGPPMDDYEQAIPKESRIAYVHKNPGNLVYDKANPAGAEPGEDKLDKDGKVVGKWARFPSVQAGFEALRGYITRHDDETIHDFISRYAPKEDGNDTEKYIADAVRELKAEPDDTVYYIDPYDLMRFIVRHESGTNMPYQYDAVDEKNKKLEDQAQKAGSSPSAAAASAAPTDDDQLEGI